jgi:putative hemolysin
MLRQERGRSAARQLKLRIQIARTATEVAEAQRLRASLSSESPGLDRDRFDPYCDHLLVRDTGTNEVVGTYRILRPEQAKLTGGLYSDTEFDLSRLDNLRPQMMEIGRACVREGYRSGSTIALLWAGLANYIQTHGFNFLVGCASMSMADGGHLAASIYNRMQKSNLGPSEWRVFPHCPLPLEALNGNLAAEVPALIEAYFRVGAYVCGAPAWDPHFNAADLFVMLPTSNIDHRYARHFLKTADPGTLL